MTTPSERRQQRSERANALLHAYWTAYPSRCVLVLVLLALVMASSIAFGFVIDLTGTAGDILLFAQWCLGVVIGVVILVTWRAMNRRTAKRLSG